MSISPSHDSEEQPNWCESPPFMSPRGGTGGPNYNSSVTSLSEDNERLRRSNNMLISELAHMKKLYNDIIYFVQNHVKPVAPSNSYHSSLLLSNTPQASANSPTATTNVSMNQLLGYYSTNPKPTPQAHLVSSPTHTSKSSITVAEEPSSNRCKTKLFGVSLQSKKRVHPEYDSNYPTNSEMNKARLVLEKNDLGLNLMPPSAC